MRKNMGDAITSATSEEDGALRGRNILLGVTGSVAAVKAPALVRQLVEIDQANVQVLLTSGGRHFWDRAAEYDEYSSASGSSIESSNQLPPTSCGTGNSTDHSRLAASTAVSDATSTPPSSAVPPGPGWIPPSVQVHYAEDEWQAWDRMGDSVLHIALRDWADVLVIAPLSAHTLAKIAHGLCDDTLSCVVRAWDLGRRTSNSSFDDATKGKPIILAPAMNTTMWEHPVTLQQLTQIQSWHAAGEVGGSRDRGVVVVPPQAKRLACGDIGVGAMADVQVIRHAVQQALSSSPTT